ncbi:MAG: MFS transporter [Alphaproteobacteria bacterium]|nr:MFS transporter [Alphaproteobacteria bacterium]
MNKNLLLLALAQGLFLTNNIIFIAINGLVGLSLAPVGWMATLPVMGYVVGGAASTGLVARSQERFGRKMSFQIGLFVAFISCALCAWAAMLHHFWGLVIATFIAGYYSANAQLYRFAAAELAPTIKEKAVSLVLAGGLLGAVMGPYFATHTKNLLDTPFAGAYVTLCVVALISAIVMSFIQFPPVVPKKAGDSVGRPLAVIMRQPLFIVAAMAAAISYGIMNLLMAATPLAMQTCGLEFDSTATVLQWHVIGMFAPGFFTGHLIQRFGVLRIMSVGVLLNIACIAVALSGVDVTEFLISSFLLGIGWNFLFTGSTTLSLQAYRPEERDRAQGAINFFVFATMAVSSFSSGALVTTQGWTWLNLGSIVPIVVIAVALIWTAMRLPTAPKP